MEVGAQCTARAHSKHYILLSFCGDKLLYTLDEVHREREYGAVWMHKHSFILLVCTTDSVMIMIIHPHHLFQQTDIKMKCTESTESNNNVISNAASSATKFFASV